MKTIDKKNKAANIGQRGSGMIEILIAAALMGVILIAVINVYSSLTALSLQNTDKIQSTFLLEEGVEAIRTMRDASWSNISNMTVGQTYYLRFQSGAWLATTTPQIVDDFWRTATVSNVSRDGSFNIVSSGGTVDANTRKVQISVAWEVKTGTTTRSVDTYIFNTFGN